MLKACGRTVIGLCALSLLSGCVQGPDYVKPTVAVPEKYRFDAQIGAKAEASDEVWWKSFGDPQIDALVREALANNRDLRIAAARVDEFAAVLAGTRAQGKPQVGYG